MSQWNFHIMSLYRNPNNRYEIHGTGRGQRGAVLLGLIVVITISAVLLAAMVTVRTSAIYGDLMFNRFHTAVYLAESGVAIVRAEKLPATTDRIYSLQPEGRMEVTVDAECREITAIGKVKPGTAYEAGRTVIVPYVPEAEGVVVDNGYAAGFSTANGTWQSSVEDTSYACDSLSTMDAGAKAIWQPNLPTAGTYQIHAWWPEDADAAQDAPYTIDYDGGSVTVQMDQRINGGQWVSLGDYPFAAGTGGTVTLVREADNIRTWADAVKFVLQ